MLDSSEKRRRITKWLLSLFTCCILIYLGFRLSLDFLYALFTPFFCNWWRSLLKLAYGIYQ